MNMWKIIGMTAAALAAGCLILWSSAALILMWRLASGASGIAATHPLYVMFALTVALWLSMDTLTLALAKERSVQS